MHDLVHDLAISVIGNKLLDMTKQENTMGTSRHYQYALLGDCTVAAPKSIAQLIALRFHDCHSTQVCGDAFAFASATSLRVLDLSECCVHNLPVSIGELKNLRYLRAPGVQNYWMFWECITKLSHLIYLHLHDSFTVGIPKSIGEMKDLMHLDLSGCQGISRRLPYNKKIKRLLPDSFMSLKKLVHLDFFSCFVTLGGSESLGSLSQLEHLNLSRCMIKGDLAKALYGLKKLQYLDISQVVCLGSICSGLQQVLDGFTKLRFLNIHGFLEKNKQRFARAETENFIEAISSLSSLEHLILAWNENLYNITESIGKLSKLRTLDLSHCRNLERLPAAISGIDNLTTVHVEGCDGLDKSTLALLKNVATVLPYFVVHAADNDSNSNLCQLENENPTKLEISGLENVKSAAEAQRIKLVEKHRIKELGLVWTRDAKRFVAEDKDVLEQLLPPCTVEKIRLQGYNSSSGLPSWMMDIAKYVDLVDVTLEDMPSCRSLPPLGLLPNLKELRIGRMDSIRKIGQDLYGGLGNTVFPRLDRFHVHEMKCLEEWNTSYSNHTAGGEDGSNKELVFPNLRCLVIADCPMLRFKSLSPLAEQTPPLPLGMNNMTIILSQQSSWKWSAKFHAVTSSAAATWLCEAHLHQWSLLRHVPLLKELRIEDCSDLTCSSTDFHRSVKTLSVRDCKSIVALPETLGDLTSLEELHISNCEGIETLPESIQQLTRLQRLEIYGCPQLVRWCISKENKMKLARIKIRIYQPAGGVKE